jgi:protein DEK
MIQEELTKLADEADDEEDGEGDAEKDENQSAGQEVETWRIRLNMTAGK